MKAILITTLCMLLLAGPVAAQDAPPDANYCAQTTSLIGPNTLICHREPLSDVEITNARTIIRRVAMLYPQFASMNSMPHESPKAPIVIVILKKKEINNPEVFSGYDISDSNATGRFLPKEKIICISKGALALNDPNLPHELAHLFNLESGIHNRAMDEQLAYAFEQFYFSR